MAKAIQAFIDDAGQRIEPGDEVWAAHERLLVLRRLGLVDDLPPASPWTHPAVVAAAAAPKPQPRVTLAKGRAGSGRRLALSLM